MKRVPIRDLHSERRVQPRFCDVVIEGGKVFLEKKNEKQRYEKISWEDVVYQVEAAKAADPS